MQQRYFVFLLFFLFCLQYCLPLAAQPTSRLAVRQEMRRQLHLSAAPLEQFGKQLHAAAEFALPSIVHIETRQIRPASSGRNERRPAIQVEESGSGIIAQIEGQLVILTNRHIVHHVELNAITIRTHNRKVLTPTKILTNEDFDLAVIEMAETETEARPHTLPEAIDFADSDKVEVGDFVLAVGSPYGLERSVSLGIISAKKRRHIPMVGGVGATPRVGFLQLDAAVNPGSSGGPVLNLRGEVVGLVTAIASQGGGNEGVAFALPSKVVQKVARQMVQNNGEVQKPQVGLAFDKVFSMQDRRRLGLDRQIGARINRVITDSPAAKAGLAIGDVILAFDGVEVEDDLHFVVLVAETSVDKMVTLLVNRNGQNLEIEITPVAPMSR